MMIKKYIFGLIIFTLIAVGGYTKYNQKRTVAKKVNNKLALNKAINLRKNKRESSKEYTLLAEKKIGDLLVHIEALPSKETNDSYASLLMGRSLIAKLDKEKKSKLFNYVYNKDLSSYKKSDLFKYRMYPHFFKDNVLESDFAKFSELFTDPKVDIEHKSLMLDEMRNWAKIPTVAHDFINSIVVDGEKPRFQEIALIYFTSLNDSEQIKATYELVNKNLKKYSESSKVIIYTVALAKSNVLSLDKDFFNELLTNKGRIWDQLKLGIIKKYSLEKKNEGIIRSIASGTNNIWVKQYANTILESLK